MQARAERAFGEAFAMAGVRIHGCICASCHRDAVRGPSAAKYVSGNGHELSFDGAGGLSDPDGLAAIAGMGVPQHGGAAAGKAAFPVLIMFEQF